MDYRIAYENWLSDPMLCAEGVSELQSIADNEQEKEYRFSTELAFGTAGMRGIIGYGTNMMNIYTVRRATKGLSDYVLSLGRRAAARGVVISYDTRNFSELFAKTAAGVLLANGIDVYMYSQPRPVPMLSFAVRELGAVAGIMITASHNPKEYNGYKVYGEDGAQMAPEATERIVEYIGKVTNYLSVKTVDINSAAEMSHVNVIGKRFERKYYKAVSKQGVSPKAVRKVGKKIKIVYTPIHGSGYVPVTHVLGKMGIDVAVVEEQIKYDGNYPTVTIPNPEVKETLAMGIELARKINASVVFGTDPDSDRLGVAVKNNDGEFVSLTGNQVGALLMEYLLLRLKQDKKLPKNAVCLKSFVSTDLAKSICASYGVPLMETPVGFKFIGEKIKEFEENRSHTFIFGFEESCGYLRGTHSRDKDAVVASMLFAELACWCEYTGRSVYSMLVDIYERLGYYYDYTENIKYSGINALATMNDAVQKIRDLKPQSINIYNIVAIRDYLSGERYESGGAVTKLEYSGMNCLYYELESGGFICIRPSGTEPKLKIYYSISGKSEEICKKTFENLSNSFSEMIKS